eukprot:1160216-Pelagomonas_calceolata.AAC.3
MELSLPQLSVLGLRSCNGQGNAQVRTEGFSLGDGVRVKGKEKKTMQAMKTLPISMKEKRGEGVWRMRKAEGKRAFEWHFSCRLVLFYADKMAASVNLPPLFSHGTELRTWQCAVP